MNGDGLRVRSWTHGYTLHGTHHLTPQYDLTYTMLLLQSTVHSEQLYIDDS